YLTLLCRQLFFCFFLLLATLPPMFYTLSLHDALPICMVQGLVQEFVGFIGKSGISPHHLGKPGMKHSHVPNPKISSPKETTNHTDRKSTRLNSSHVAISYAVFCLKKKKNKTQNNKKNK